MLPLGVLLPASLPFLHWFPVMYGIPGARETLRQWRDENDRRSEETVEIWYNVIAKHVNKLGDESKLSTPTHARATTAYPVPTQVVTEPCSLLALPFRRVGGL